MNMMKIWTYYHLLVTNSCFFVSSFLILPKQSSYYTTYRHEHRVHERNHYCPHHTILFLSTTTRTTTTTRTKTLSSSITTTTKMVSTSIHSTSCAEDGDNDDVPTTTTTSPKVVITSKKSKRLYSFHEARRIARGHGFDTYEEFMDYSCPGAYQIPKDANIVWNKEWRGWDDFLGLPLSFHDAREIARSLQDITDERSYLQLMENKVHRISDDDAASRLPYRPDLKYKLEWKGWDDFLNATV